MTDLLELDSLEVLAIIDNELDPISPCTNPLIQHSGGGKDISLRGPHLASDPRGPNAFEFRMDNICCSAHGLSLMITGVKDGVRRTILLDTGPEGTAWERNANRLRADVASIEVVALSHWHRDHSRGMLKVLDMIRAARSDHPQKIDVDVHPDRPDCRGVQPPGAPVFSFEPDPSFDEIGMAGGNVMVNDQPHTVLGGMFLISGQIPRRTEYEKGFKFGVRFEEESGKWEKDEDIADERLLMCKLKDKGIVMFTGCGHSGIVNSSRHAIELGQGMPFYAAVGGFHLADAPPPVVQSTVADLKALQPKLLLAGHCTGWRAKFELNKQMPECFVPCTVGSKFVL